MTVTQRDPRVYPTTTLEEVGQALAYMWDRLDLAFDSLLGAIGATDSLVNAVYDQGVIVIPIVTQIRDRLGDPGSGTNIDAKLNIIRDNVGDADEDLAELQDAIGFRTSGQIDLLGATQNIIDGATVYMQAKTAASKGTSILDTVTNTIGSIIAGKYGGGSDLVTIGKWLAGLWDVPPIDVLSEGGSVALAASTTLTIPSGVYGYHLTFTVPGYWGQLSSDPVVYQPHVAVAAWRGPYGTVGPVAFLSTPQSQAYPRPPGALYIDITLRPGITGTYKELRFLGL